MENGSCEIKMELIRGQDAYITFVSSVNRNNGIRHGTVTISSTQTRDNITMSLPELRQFLDKFERSEFDAVITTAQWPTTTFPFGTMKLFKYECGEFFVLQYRDSRIRFTTDLIHKLMYTEQKLITFIEDPV